MADNRLLITASLNVGTSIGEINKKIREISNHPSLQRIKLKIDIDNKILQTLHQFNANLNKINQTMGQQSNVTERASKSAKSNASAIDSETGAINRQNKALDENIRKKKEYHSAPDADGKTRLKREDVTTGNRFDSSTSTKIYNDDNTISDLGSVRTIDPQALKEAENNLKRFTENSNVRLKELRKHIGNNNSEVKSLKSELGQLSMTSDKTDFARFNDKLSELEKRAKDTVKGFNELDDVTRNIGKRIESNKIKDEQLQADHAQKAQLQAYEQRIKLTEQQARIERGYIQDSDRAHYEAFLEKEKRESHLGNALVQDRTRAHELALVQDAKFNQQRFLNEQKFARMQQDTFNKIEIARMKYGHHKGVNANLDAALFTAQSVKVTDDYTNALRNVNTTVAQTTAGMKAAKATSLGFGEAFSTAINLTVAHIRNCMDSQSVNL